MEHVLNGACHCGAHGFQLHTDQRPSDIVTRACDCRFCRIHGSRNWSDPRGRVVLTVQPPRLQKYRFALKTVDFYLCRICGAYLAAVLEEAQGCWSTVNLRLAEGAFGETPAHYGAEDTAQRLDRRRAQWTPTRIEPAASR